MKILHYEDIKPTRVEEEKTKGVTVRWLISKEDGAENFAMRFFEIDPGGNTPLHSHKHEHEVFIIEGEGAVWRNGDEIPIKPGTAVFVPPKESHCFINNSQKKLKFICLIPAYS